MIIFIQKILKDVIFFPIETNFALEIAAIGKEVQRKGQKKLICYLAHFKRR